jgi:O-antigen ligase
MPSSVPTYSSVHFGETASPVIRLKSDTIENKISFYHLAAFVILLPYERFYGQLVFFSLCLHCLIHLRRDMIGKIWSRENLVLVSVFLLNLAGIIYSSDKGDGVKDLVRQLTILLFPILLSISKIDLAAYRNSILKIFTFSCVGTVLYLYLDALRIIFYYDLNPKTLFSQVFLNHNFSEPIGIHATYLSMYLALSVTVFLYFLLLEKRLVVRISYVACIGILLAGLIQLASRSVFIAMILVVITVSTLFLSRGLQRSGFLMAAAGILLIAVLGISRIDSLKKRYVADFKDDLTQASSNNDILESRVSRWNCAVALCLESPVIGHGSGSEKRLLKEKYFERKLYHSYIKELNAHNQYLSILLKTGLLGLLVFLGMLLCAYRIAWKNKDMILTGFLIVFSIVSFSENTLDVNKGIFFYAFFLSFLVKSSRK